MTILDHYRLFQSARPAYLMNSYHLPSKILFSSCRFIFLYLMKYAFILQKGVYFVCNTVFAESYKNLFLDFVRKNALKLNIKNVGNNNQLKEMIEQMIFSEQGNQNKEDNRITYCDLLDDDHYVAQFLNVADIHFEVSQDLQVGPVVEVMIQEPNKEQVNAESGPLQAQKQHKKRSSFHNFQKHLVTTIRSIVDNSKFGKNSDTATCQKKIWKVFVNSNKINKTLVQVIVGDLTQEPSGKINEYGFKEIMKEFKPEVVKQAQQNLSAQLMRQLMQAKLENELSSRRMKHKKQFVIYFRAFLEELENGELDKRMAKCTKLLRNENL